MGFFKLLVFSEDTKGFPDAESRGSAWDGRSSETAPNGSLLHELSPSPAQKEHWYDAGFVSFLGTSPPKNSQRLLVPGLRAPAAATGSWVVVCPAWPGKGREAKGRRHTILPCYVRSPSSLQKSQTLVERVHPQSFHNWGEATDGLVFVIACAL